MKQAFGLWDEAKVPREYPHMRKENMETPLWQDLHSEAVMLTTTINLTILVKKETYRKYN